MNEMTNIRDWYLSTFPEDGEGQALLDGVTFLDLFEAMDAYKDVYETLFGDPMGGDTVIRERVFEALAGVMGVSYDNVYDQWMLAADMQRTRGEGYMEASDNETMQLADDIYEMLFGFIEKQVDRVDKNTDNQTSVDTFISDVIMHIEMMVEQNPGTARAILAGEDERALEELHGEIIAIAEMTIEDAGMTEGYMESKGALKDVDAVEEMLFEFIDRQVMRINRQLNINNADQVIVPNTRFHLEQLAQESPEVIEGALDGTMPNAVDMLKRDIKKIADLAVDYIEDGNLEEGYREAVGLEGRIEDHRRADTDTVEMMLETFFNKSALTFEGLAVDSIPDALEFFIEEKGQEDAFANIFSGEQFNEIFRLSGSNAYPEDFAIVVFENTGTVLAITIGARWLDDIVNNNAEREGYHPFDPSFGGDWYNESYDMYEGAEKEKLISLTESNNKDFNLGDNVKIIQKNAPYNSFGKAGVITNIEYDEFKDEWWYSVQFDEENEETPYESWFVKEHLMLINYNESYDEAYKKYNEMDELERLEMQHKALHDLEREYAIKNSTQEINSPEDIETVAIRKALDDGMTKLVKKMLEIEYQRKTSQRR